MNPLQLSENIEKQYRRYLRTMFYFRDPILRKSFEEALEKEGNLSKGPYVEATPVFRKGKTSRKLFEELLHYKPDDGFLKATDRILYEHQEEAIRRVFNERNIVVATGTGSGKTEAFIYPILLSLYEQYKQGILNTYAGVRALILYPMNALVNDQRDRLGSNDESSPGICSLLKTYNSDFNFTYGQYTGDTPEDKNDTFRNARTKIDGRYTGELVLRKEMRGNPPHILLTNYSMLEYLLLRPDDSPLFDNGRAEYWNFLILDEAHQYRGAKGIEMAMLIRRLKQRLREGGMKGKFKCIATSASIAGGESDKTKVAQLASDLFGEPFESDDVIFGGTESSKCVGTILIPTGDYSMLIKSLQESNLLPSDLISYASEHGIETDPSDNTSEVIGRLLESDTRFEALKNKISSTPEAVSTLCEELFTELDSSDQIKAFVDLVYLSLDSIDKVTKSPLMSVRYHFFLRSLEGAMISYLPMKKIFLNRQSESEDFKCFEVALCRECGQHYIVGRNHDGKLVEAVRDPGREEFGAKFYLPLEDEKFDELLSDEDENNSSLDLFELCMKCASLSPVKNGKVTNKCEHEERIKVVLLKSSPLSKNQDKASKCIVCGYSYSDPIREVLHGTDGPHAVIATTLHQHLPSERRKVLAFADGRQEAAFFAWYLQQSYVDIRNRNLLYKSLTMNGPPDNGLSIHDVAKRLRDLYRKEKVFEASRSDNDILTEAYKAVYREFLTDEPRISLEGVGLIQWTVDWPEDFEFPEELFKPPWSFDKDKVINLITILLGFMRNERSVELQNPVSLQWSDLLLQASQISTQLVKARNAKLINSWKGKNTKRAGYLKRILKGNLAEDQIEANVETILEKIWEAIRKWNEKHKSDEQLLIRIQDSSRINPDWWRVFPITDNKSVFQCDACGRLSGISIRNICPRHRCPGSLHEVEIDSAILKENHYRILYLSNLPPRINVEEHTAQIDKEKAREFQFDFKNGKIDLLSCSTTFELGVDLGDLDVIFLRNVPPEAFNYSQRVGRAGRRKGYPGIAITYSKKSPHDLYHFRNPNQMIKGVTRVPALRMANEKIILRHVAAVALSVYFRDNKERFESVERLVDKFENPRGCSDIRKFFESNIDSLKEILLSIVPKEMWGKVGIQDNAWIEKICGSVSRLKVSEDEVCSDYCALADYMDRSSQSKNFKQAQWAQARTRTIAEEDLISFLSRKTIIPKYGFPVDVVELETHTIRSKDKKSTEVSLQRDLSIAIAEFAPSNKLIANKKVWTSAGLKRVASKEWERRKYARCNQHNIYIQWGVNENREITKCCNRMILGEYIDPIFGFVTNTGKPEEPKGRTQKDFTTRPYFVGFNVKEPVTIKTNGYEITKSTPAKMVVLCEGYRGKGFGICTKCGAGFKELTNTILKEHKSPIGEKCHGTFTRVSLGHEFETDVVCIKFLLPNDSDHSVWFSYSIAYALVEGIASILEVPTSDLNATVESAIGYTGIAPIILYDNVPGGAGLVSRLEDNIVLKESFYAAFEKVNNCSCGENESCYACLRNYRNQFAHENLQRGPAARYLGEVIKNL